MNDWWQFLDHIFTMKLGFCLALSDELNFLILIDEGADHWVEVSGLPEELGSFSPENFFI